MCVHSALSLSFHVEFWVNELGLAISGRNASESYKLVNRLIRYMDSVGSIELQCRCTGKGETPSSDHHLRYVCAVHSYVVWLFVRWYMYVHNHGLFVYSVTSLSAPQISSFLTFCSSFCWNKSAVILLYTILLLPHFIQFPHFTTISSRTSV